MRNRPMQVKGIEITSPPEDAVFEYQILDSRDRHAPWLEKYLNKSVDERLYQEFIFEQNLEMHEERCF